ncbi:response regulator [Nocardia sp. NPDC058058]|uniref:response regulator n=1 Tax=Nocardia sp. NPDC058058 TaxID=3346317 RepID=UPI0036DC17F5
MDTADDRRGALIAMISVLVIDDHNMLRGALCEILDQASDITVIGEAADGRAGVERAELLRPDVVILDVEIPGDDVVQTLRKIQQASPESRVLIVSMHQDMSLIRELVEHGIAGYLHKSARLETLLSAIRTADGDGEVIVYVSWQEDRRARADSRSESPDQALTARELEIVELVASAMSNRQIANALGITEGTVKRHLRNIFRKLGAVSRLDTVKRATAAKLIGPYSPE